MSRVRFLRICALTLALPAFAQSSPLASARAFWSAWSRGDVAAAVASWDPGRVQRFRDAFVRETELSCVHVSGASLRLVREAPATAAVEVDALVERDVVASGAEFREEAHFVIELQSIDSSWRVIDFQRREDLLARELVKLDAGSREARIAQTPELATPRLVVELSRSAILLSSRQRSADAIALLAFARRIAEDNDSDVARSAILAAESVDRRRNAEAKDALAVRLAEEAERLAVRSGDPDAVARARVRLARALEEIDFARAHALASQVVASAGRLFDPASVALAALQLSWLYGSKMDSRGYGYALLGAQYAALSGDPSARLNATMTLAGGYAYSNDPELSRRHYQDVVRVAQETNALVAELNALSGIVEADATLSPDTVPAAISRIVELAACAGEPASAMAAPMLVLRARTELAHGDFASCRRDLDAALDLLIRVGIDEQHSADAIAAEAELLFAQHDPQAALRVLDEAEAFHDMRPEVASEKPFAVTRARVLHELRRDEEAILVLQDAIERRERGRVTLPLDPRARESFFRRSDLYDDLVELLARHGRSAEAIAYAELRASRTLQDYVRTPRVRSATSPEVDRAERKVVRLNRAVFAARPGDPSLPRLKDELLAARLELDDVRIWASLEPQEPGPAATLPVLDLRNIGTRAAIVRYFVTREQTFAFVVRDGFPIVTKRIAVREDELRTRVNALRERIASRDADYRAVAATLHALLVAPLRDELRDIERVTIVPDGPLAELPFQVLLDDRGHDLLRRFDVRYAPTVASCLRDAGNARRPASILALGDPEIGAVGQATVRSLVPGETLGRLADAGREAREVAKLYSQSRVLTGAAADESALKGEHAHFDVVHVATHALVDEAQPLYSSLVLAAGRPDEDGLLEAREILSLDLGAELFVLSACSTAGGRNYRGEGVVGLAWALLSSGVPHVVVSQWSTDSRASRKLMVAFHRFLVAGETPSSALRHAQLELRRDPRYEDPLYWAPFIVVGTARDYSPPPVD